MISCKQRFGNQLILHILSEEANAVLSSLYAIYQEKGLTITSLSTLEDHRGKGYASALLKRAIWEAHRNGVCQIELDDCSGGSSIYTQHGFHYVDPGFPEMYRFLR
jgi:GNAT superfamily N-acetyltransferase